MNINFLKGTIGEGRVIQELNRLPRKDYYLLNDILVENNGYYAQIDHVLVSQKSIYLIETKNWSGKLYGDQYSDEWKQYIHGTQYKQFNPVKQSWMHKRMFLEVFEREVKKVDVQSIVVFLDDLDISHVSTEANILKLDELILYIENDPGGSYPLSDVEALQLFEAVNRVNILDEAKRREHLELITVKSHPPTILKDIGIDSKERLSLLGPDESTHQDVKDVDPSPVVNTRVIEKRILSSVIDWVAIAIVLIPVLVAYEVKDSRETALAIFLFLLLFLLFEQGKLWAKGQSIGKHIMKIQVVDDQSLQPLRFMRMFKREVFRSVLGVVTYGIVYLVIIFRKRNQAVHDILINSIVIDAFVDK